MQPPTRKGGFVKFLKNLHAEQVAKLQVKNQTECELLEDLRTFIIKKSTLEKSYCEALLKITSVYLNRKITTSIPDLKTEGSDEKWNMWSVWRTVLEENEKLSKTRLAAIEVLSQQIADDAKYLRIHKLQTTKKCVDLLASMQKELQFTVQDVEKTKKVYFDEEHSAHDVRDKAKDIEARLKRKKGSFFQSLTTLQKSSAKVSLKRELMDDKSVGARNDYLLSLATANAHQTRYFVNDLQTIMQIMESGVYDKVQQFFLLLSKTELLTCTAKQNSFTKIKNQSQKLTREYNLQCLFLYYPVLKQHIQYEFEACNGDNIDYITSGNSTTALQFVEEVKDWLEVIAREKSVIRNKRKKLRNLLELKESGEKMDPNDANGTDIDTKIDELQDAIRKSEVIKIKFDAKIELLKKSSDDNVKDMCKKLEDEMSVHFEEQKMLEDSEEALLQTSNRVSVSETAAEQSDDKNYSSEEETTYRHVERSASTDEENAISSTVQTVYKTPTQAEDVFKQLEVSWDTVGSSDEVAALPTESFSLNIHPPDEHAAQNLSYEEFDAPFKCVVMYNYSAQNPDELTISAGEELKILGEGDGDGWLRACNSSGQEGFVPCTYIESYSGGEEDMYENFEDNVMVGGSHLTSQMSFSSVDYTVNASKNCTGGGWSPSGVTTVRELDTENTSKDFNQRAHQLDDDVEYCIALYDYEANGEDELTFQEGQVIHILRKVIHDGIDDGWWEGEVDGVKGLFPSLMVQVCADGGESFTYEDDYVDLTSAPPLFTPPEIPDLFLPEHEDNVNTGNISNGKYSVEKTNNQQPPQNSQSEENEQSAKNRILPDSGHVVPGISINLVCDDDSTQNESVSISIGVAHDDENVGQPANNVREENNDSEFSVAEIVITAATPGVESANKTFASEPSPNDSQIAVASSLLERRKSAGEINEADPPLYDASLNECLDYPTTIIEEPEEEEEEEKEYERAEKSELNECDERRRRSSLATRPSSTACPLMVPGELEPHQLQRLQQMKESNA